MLSRFLSPIIWILGLFLALFLYTKVVGPIPLSINSVVTQKTTTFDVTSEGKVTVLPDIAIVNVGVSANGSTVKATQDLLNSNINKVSLAIKALGIDKKDIQTTNYNINPSFDNTLGTQKITGYIANTNLTIKVRNIDQSSSVLDAATASGANQVGGISFDLDDKSKAEDEARQIAVSGAKKKAETAAKITGFRLGRIVNYTEDKQNLPRPIPMALNSLKSADSTSPTQVETGSSDITVSVTLSYEIQ